MVVIFTGTTDLLALNDNRLVQWKSPDGKFAVAEEFYGEGKRVIGVFIHRRTGVKDRIYPAPADDLNGARSLEVKWSANSRYFSLSADRSKFYGEALVFYVTSARKSYRVILPKKLTSAGLENLIPTSKRDRAGAWFDRTNWAEKWLPGNRLKLVVDGDVHLLGDNDSTHVERHYLVGFHRGRVVFITSPVRAK